MKRAEITRIREKAGLSKTELGRVLGRSYRTILRWEEQDSEPMARCDEIVLELLDSGELPQRYIAPAKVSKETMALANEMGNIIQGAKEPRK